jgi:epoxide hydrolase-like predicted phosphatase
MKVRAICWDLGGVILRTHDRSGRDRWEHRLGLEPGDLDKLVFGGRAARLAMLGKEREEAIWLEVLDRFSLPRTEAERLASDFFSGDRLDHGLLEIIRDLRPAYKTGLISNAWPDIRLWLEERWRIADAFDTLVISAEVGLAKPDARIYQIALDQLQVSPAETVFVDDFEENIVGAREVGMAAIQFHSPEQALGELQGLLQ